ncbi:hypothetical protein [Mycobacterium botniense]|uniref:Uncharacterized protein n=1 Tax=Mycobacterium botniense TaxID=84962 RepID=A0A7I9XTF3_9MYCO|nr:hypothetical protein [Mycobacterium botniense]GFG73272.1 hypothetical protein MBOT_06370 [Mycobacterium botniense]
MSGEIVPTLYGADLRAGALPETCQVLGGRATTTWSIIGPITVLIGVVIAVFSWRKLSAK